MRWNLMQELVLVIDSKILSEHTSTFKIIHKKNRHIAMTVFIFKNNLKIKRQI